MKRKQSIISLLCAAAMLLSLCGCSSLGVFFAKSKHDVLLQLTQYIDGREPTAATVTLDLILNSEADGEPISSSLSLTNRTQMASETDSYGDGDFACRIGDQEYGGGVQVYNFTEDGKLLTFTHVDSGNSWFRSETELPEQLPAPTPKPTPVPEEGEAAATPEVTVPEEYEFLLLEEGSHSLNGQEVYTLTGSVSGDSCKALLLDSLQLDALTARLLSSSDDVASVNLKDLDFSALSADVTVYLDKMTCAPIQIELTLHGTNLLITHLMEMLPEQAAELLGSAVTVESFDAVISDISFEPVSVPKPDEEARMMAMQESFDPDRGDGTYILQQHGHSVKITAQNGWSATELGYCFAMFHNSDQTGSAHYMLYRDMTGEEFISLIESGMIPDMEAQEVEVTIAAGEPIGEYQTYGITGNGISVYLAYRTVGDCFLGIYAEDSTGAKLSSVLTPILAAVEDYQLEY